MTRGEKPAFLDRDDAVVSRVDDKRPRPQLAGELADVEPAARFEEPHRGLGGGGDAKQVLVPGHFSFICE